MHPRRTLWKRLAPLGLVVLGLALASLTVGALAASVKRPAERPANPFSQPNYVGDHAVVGPQGSRYFCEPGSSTITVLGTQNNVLQTLTVRDERGTPLAIERLYFDKPRGELLAIAGPDLYTIDAAGHARLQPLPQGANRDPLYGRLERRQQAAGSIETRAAKQKAGAIAERLQRGERVSATDQEYLDAYNGPAARSGGAGALDTEAEFECNCIQPPYASGYLDLAIPNNTGNGACVPVGGISNTITLPAGAGTIADVNILVNITHTAIGNLVIDVTHNGTTVLLFSRLYDGCDDLHAVFGTAVDDDTRTICPDPGCLPLIDLFSCGNMDLSVFNGMDASGDWTLRVADHNGTDVGSLSDWAVCITPTEFHTDPVCGCPEPGFGSGTVNLAIPDNTGSDSCNATGGISSAIVVPAGTGVLSDVNVSVNLLHTWAGDLVIDLTHGATTVRLLTHVPTGFGESCDNISTVFDDEGNAWVEGDCPHTGCTRTFDPFLCGGNLLSAFNGQVADGVWTLRIVDVAAGDHGTLADWSLCFNAPDPVVCEVCPDGTIESGAIDLPIPEAGTDLCTATGGATHTLMVPPGSGLVQDVNIGLDITHAFMGDLAIDVTHNGTTVRLRSGDPIDEDCDNYDGLVFDDEGDPYVGAECPHSGCYQTTDPGGCGGAGLLSAFDGMPAEGAWTIRVVDRFLLNQGVLNAWHLCLDTELMPGHVSVEVEFPDFSCDAGGLTPNPFTYIIHATNTGDAACDGVDITLFAGAGPGGTAVVTLPTMSIPSLAPGQTVDLLYEVTVTPSGTGGCLAGAITVATDNCGSYVIDFFCLIDVPGCEGAPGPCGCMDVVLAVDVTGSMFAAIGNVVSELPNIVSQANAASGGDLRLGLVTFRDQVITVNELTFDQAAVTANIGSLAAGGGDDEPEASDEALREILTHDALCTDGSEFATDFRAPCAKVVVLITDARPGGCDDVFIPGVDDANAHQRALDALGLNVPISAVYVPSFPDYTATIIPIMQDYATTSGGSFVITNSDGSGTGAAIASIIENCGGEHLPDDCLPDGPACFGQAPLIYTSLSGLIDDAVVCVTGDSLRMDWRRVGDAEFYQIYRGGIDEAPVNYAPIGTAFDTTYFLPAELLAAAPSGRVVSFFVQAKRAEPRLVGANLACWPMDEGIGALVEDFAQDNDGTIHGADWIPGAPGHSGLRFGYGDYVDVLNDVEFYGQPLQIDACVTIPSYPTIPTGAFYIFSCHRYATWFQGFGLRIDVNGRLLSEVWNQSTNSWNTLWAPLALRVPLNEPFLVTAVINGDASLLLLNGNVVAAGTQDYISVTNGFHMTIGAHNYNSDRYQYHMRGDIHWLKIAQSVLDPE